MHKLRSLTSYSLNNNRLKNKGIQIFKDSQYIDYRSKILQLVLYYKEEKPLFKNLKKYYVIDEILDTYLLTAGFYID